MGRASCPGPLLSRTPVRRLGQAERGVEERVGVHPDPRGHAPSGTPVAEGEGEDPFRLPGLEDHGDREPTSAHLQDRRVAVAQPELFRIGHGDGDGVAPGDLRHRVGQLLEPAVVGVAAVVDRRGWSQDEFVALGGGRGRCAFRCRRDRRAVKGQLGLRLLAAHETVVERHLEIPLEGNRRACGIDFLPPAVLHEREEVRGRGGTQGPGPGQQDLFSLARVVQRTHGRLLEAPHAVGTIVISPGLEPVVLGEHDLAPRPRSRPRGRRSTRSSALSRGRPSRRAASDAA